jgi:hypothetical protein
VLFPKIRYQNLGGVNHKPQRGSATARGGEWEATTV